MTTTVKAGTKILCDECNETVFLVCQLCPQEAGTVICNLVSMWLECVQLLCFNQSPWKLSSLTVQNLHLMLQKHRPVKNNWFRLWISDPACTTVVFIEWLYWWYSEEFILAVFTQTQNFSEYYPDEPYVEKQMSKWAGPDIKGLHPARSFIQSLCNVWLIRCVNKGGHCQEQGFPLEYPKKKLSFPRTQICKIHHELPQHLLWIWNKYDIH